MGSLTTKVSYLEKGTSTKTSEAVAPQAAAPAGAGTQPATGKAKPVGSDEHIRGGKNAKVTLIEYSDLECPFCKTFHPTMLDILKTYGEKVRWVYRHYPLSFHANAQKEAEATECVTELGGNDAFWNYVDKIFERTTSNGTGFALEKLGPLAGEVGVDQTQFQKCLDSGKYTQKVKDELSEGTQAGVNGTPSTFVLDSKGNNQLIVGAQPKESVTATIDKILK